jgi:hypothetical protein
MCDMYGCVDESVEGKSIWSARQGKYASTRSPLGALLMASTAPDLADQLMLMLWMSMLLSSSTYYTLTYLVIHST